MIEVRVSIRTSHINWVLLITIISVNLMNVFIGPEWLVLIISEVILEMAVTWEHMTAIIEIVSTLDR